VKTPSKGKESKALPKRECTKITKHAPHKWYSYTLNGEAQCTGTGVPTSSYATVGYKKFTRDNPDEPLGVREARKIAFAMHSTQKDKSGEPYAKHLEAVRLGTVVLGGDAEVQIAALFHDAVEDNKTSPKILRELGVTERSLIAIEAVTKRSSEPQGDYLERIVKAGEDAMRVKVADLLHNTRHDRLKELPESTRDRLLKKYRPALARLLLELNMIVDEDEQKKLATKPQGSATGSWTSSPGKGQSFAIGSLIRGDWPSTWSAPIMEIEKGPDNTRMTFILANGEVRTEYLRVSKNSSMERKLWVYPRSAWEHDSKITFSGVTETQILQYADLV